MTAPRYPSLYQINTRVWLTEFAKSLGRPATLRTHKGSAYLLPPCVHLKIVVPCPDDLV